MMKYYVNDLGEYLGGFSEGNDLIPEGAVEVPNAPDPASRTWDGEQWSAYVPTVAPDPDADLEADIKASTNFAELKAALLGNGPNQAKVRGRK